jgi:nuclear pore complex protein Nup155
MVIDTLYNTYAQPYGMWDSCLQLCNAANSVPLEYVRNLWDLLLKHAWEAAVGADGRTDSDVRLALCCERTQQLGAQFYPNDNRWVGAAG